MKKKYIIPLTEVIATKTESLLHAGTIVNQLDDKQHYVEDEDNPNIEVDSKKNYWDRHFEAWSN